MFCVRHTTMHQFTVKGYFMQSHICTVHVCLAVTSHLHFWQSDQGLLCAAVVTPEEWVAGWVGGGWNGCRNESAQKGDPGEENSPTTPART